MPRYSFGPFLLDPEARLLRRDGEPVPMTGKTLDLLVALVEDRGRLVDKDELLSRVWAGAVVEEANLSQGIFTLRKILGDSPKERRYIATVAGRGYQFVGEVIERTNEAPRETTPPVRRRRGLAAAVLVAAGIAGAAIFWFVTRHPTDVHKDFVERQLTFNSSANNVLGADISPDGKYLAYSDPSGIHIRLLSTGEDRLIPMHAGVSCWFPNGTELLVHSNVSEGHSILFAISVMGQSSRELRADAVGWSVSPDGTRIAFSPARPGGVFPEIWVMNSDGTNPQQILSLAENEFLWSVRWSPDGTRLAYIRARRGHESLETSDLKGANRTTVVAAPGDAAWVRSLYWLRDGRMLYSQAEATDLDANLWQIRVDENGAATSKPARVTRWIGTDVQELRASADGTKLVLLKASFPAQIYIGELAAGNRRPIAPRQLTTDEASDAVWGWTADSKAVLFNSNRAGKWGIFRQSISQGAAEPLVEGREFLDQARLSPDGAWVLFGERLVAGPNHTASYRLMRAPLNGGAPKLLFESTSRWDDFECATAPANLCVIFDTSDDLLTIAALDPVNGKGKVLRTIGKKSNEMFNQALSPDGKTIALAKGDEPEIHVHLLALDGGGDREFIVKGWPNSVSLRWSADGKWLYAGSESAQRGTLLRVDLQGAAQILWQSTDVGGGAFVGGIPSPDGRYLALTGAIHKSNAWMIEGF